ncbi:hypothetical protein OCGS_0719 [Oceaniovalibus guishaninsula JLT2003]|uniref:Protein nucleotidyltransferase YdiU n=1 Tax=Oceaniovalibus guishaninsula JLT2003 TaxID=1231392 RepID=K2HQC8_9RHOB|nr:YdiU family protein [Oceaniovalibus guishaninsula]EKE45024.1 hypothetical protein OCGS_0719 [Oceaniovalibus guishaninsula JLT2003]
MQNAPITVSRYADLPGRMWSHTAPTPVAAPRLLAANDALAAELGLPPGWLRGDEALQILAGNLVPEGTLPIAQAYAGHQFGGWSPQLGDGRAVLLGEAAGRDIVLKGAGRTPWSRGGDGRAWLGPVLREYLVSEAMHALGIPTTRALAAVATGETVLRERPLPGAVLTRVARSHVRVGTYEYLASRNDTDGLAALTDHVIARLHPQAGDAWGLLDAVIDAQARLIAGWMGLGFIHGVMNTDNMAVSGETIDYGPCAFMDAYHPDTVFSSIDRFGRYAYAAQPTVAVWNLAQFASALLPLMGGEAGIPRATEMVNSFPARFGDAWLGVFRAKLGLVTPDPGDADLIQTLLGTMAAQGADFTLTFRGLTDGTARAGFADPAPFDAWAARWSDRREADPVNPAVIPRNHHVEAAIAAAVDGDLSFFDALLAAVTRPFQDDPVFAAPPRPGEEVTATFCGT